MSVIARFLQRRPPQPAVGPGGGRAPGSLTSERHAFGTEPAWSPTDWLRRAAELAVLCLAFRISTEIAWQPGTSPAAFRPPAPLLVANAAQRATVIVLDDGSCGITCAGICAAEGTDEWIPDRLATAGGACELDSNGPGHVALAGPFVIARASTPSPDLAAGLRSVNGIADHVPLAVAFAFETTVSPPVLLARRCGIRRVRTCGPRSGKRGVSVVEIMVR